MSTVNVMKAQKIFLILVLGVLTPLCGVFSASGERTSSGAVILEPKTESGVSASELKTDTGSKKDDKKSFKKPLFSKPKTDSFSGALDDGFSQEEKEKVQQEINDYILEAYKIQGNKILRDIDVSLQKINPDADTRIQAYNHIQKTLEMRKKLIQSMDLSDNNKQILQDYLNYMIQALEKRKTELQS